VNVAPGTIQVWSDLLCPFAQDSFVNDLAVT
jgi:hypothetical protein